MADRIIGFNAVLLLVGGMVPVLRMPFKGVSSCRATSRPREVAPDLSGSDHSSTTDKRYRERVLSILILDSLRAMGP